MYTLNLMLFNVLNWFRKGFINNIPFVKRKTTMDPLWRNKIYK